jgi:hypothetical protein
MKTLSAIHVRKFAITVAVLWKCENLPLKMFVKVLSIWNYTMNNGNKLDVCSLKLNKNSSPYSLVKARNLTIKELPFKTSCL